METRTSGSEGGPGRRTELKSRHRALVRPYEAALVLCVDEKDAGPGPRPHLAGAAAAAGHSRAALRMTTPATARPTFTPHWTWPRAR